MADPERPDAARAAAEEYDRLFAGAAVVQLAAIIRRHFAGCPYVAALSQPSAQDTEGEAND